MMRILVLAMIIWAVSAKPSNGPMNMKPTCDWSSPKTHYGVAGHDITILQNKHLKECKVACEDLPGCKSIDYSPSEKECRLNDIAVPIGDLDKMKYFKYYECDRSGEATPAPTATTAAPTPGPVAKCYCWGDPHCVPFKATEILIRGSCSHILSTDECSQNEGSVSYTLIATFQLAKATTTRSYVHEMMLDYRPSGEQFVIRFEQGPKIVALNVLAGDSRDIFDDFDGSGNFAGLSFTFVNSPGGDWADSEKVVFFEMENDVVIGWDGEKKVTVEAPEALGSGLCGICGSMDGKMYIGPHDSSHKDDNTGCPSKAASMTIGSETTDMQEYGDSWYFGSAEDSERCKEECNQL